MLLKINNITKIYSSQKGFFKKELRETKALDDVSVSLEQGKVLGVVGESGSGKTTLGKAICRLIQHDSGEILLQDKPIESYKRENLAELVQMIFQDPFSSLNPKLSIKTILTEASFHLPKESRKEKIAQVLNTVGFSQDILSFYPHQFSGGQRQRIAIARAIIKNPKLIIADEPLSSLDVSIQNQLLDLFLKLKNQFSISFVFISHDIVTTSILSDYTIVMKDGKIVEQNATNEIMNNPKDAYTKRLLNAMPLLT